MPGIERFEIRLLRLAWPARLAARSGERTVAQTDPGHPQGVAFHLRIATRARRADVGPGAAGQPQAGRPTDARGPDPGSLPATTPRLHRPRPGRAGLPGPGQPRLQRGRT